MILHPQGVVDVAILRAADATGIDSTFLLGAAKRESGYNPAARAPTSSAEGLFQFIEQTWLATLKRHGARHGYARYAELIVQGPDGRFHATDPEARRAVMNLRLDPHAAALMAGEMTADHAAYLRRRIGRRCLGDVSGPVPRQPDDLSARGQGRHPGRTLRQPQRRPRIVARARARRFPALCSGQAHRAAASQRTGGDGPGTARVRKG